MAITFFNLGTGSRPTVGWDGVDWYALHQDNLFYRVTRNGTTLLLSAAVTPGTLAFPKLDGIRAVLRDGVEGLLWPDVRQPFATTKQVLVASCTGNEPIIQGEGFYAWQTGGGFTVQRQPIAGGPIVSLGVGRPTGLSRVLAGGAIVLIDTDFTFRMNGVVVGTRPAFSGGAVAVEDASGAGIRVFYGSSILLWPGETAFTPQVALSGANNALLVATWGGGSGSPRVALITLDEFTGTPPSGPPGSPGGSYGPPLSSPAAGSTPTQKLVELGKLEAARRPRPVFPHVDQVGDQNAQVALRILFDRVFQVEQQIQGSGGVASQILTLQQAQAADRASVATQLTQLSVAATGTTPAVGGAFPSPTPPNGGGGGTPPPGGGGGGGSGSCAGAPATGHIPAGELTFTRMAQIICGTANEWSQYLVATSTLAQRETNAETLILRMIWHLAQGGFTAGRQRNPSTAISKDKLACVILTETRAFDVFRDFDNYQATLRVGPVEVFPADLVASAGISD